MKTLIEHLAFAITCDAADRVIEDASLVVENDRIVAIGPSTEVEQQYPRQSFDRIIDGRHYGATPGFIDAHVHLLLASSREETGGSIRNFGVGPVARIAANGGLGSNLVLAHASALGDDEVELLAEAGTKVAFCPGTSLKLAKGATSIGKYPEMMAQGITVALGTDGPSASGNLSLMRQMYLVAGLFKDARLDATQVGARQALRMATIDGARALLLDQLIGSLEAGKKADFVLFDLDHVEWTPYFDPVQSLVWSASPASIAETWIDGNRVFFDGRVSTLDEVALRREARERAAALRKRAQLVAETTSATAEAYN